MVHLLIQIDTDIWIYGCSVGIDRYMAPLLLFADFVSILKEMISYKDIAIFILMLPTTGVKHLDAACNLSEEGKSRELIKHGQYCSYL